MSAISPVWASFRGDGGRRVFPHVSPQYFRAVSVKLVVHVAVGEDPFDVKFTSGWR